MQNLVGIVEAVGIVAIAAGCAGIIAMLERIAVAIEAGRAGGGK